MLRLGNMLTFGFCFHLSVEQAHVGAIQKTHLRDLMADADRCKAMTAYDLTACARDIFLLLRACLDSVCLAELNGVWLQ